MPAGCSRIVAQHDLIGWLCVQVFKFEDTHTVACRLDLIGGRQTGLGDLCCEEPNVEFTVTWSIRQFPQLVSKRSAVLPEQTNTRVQISGKHSSLALLQQHAVLGAQ